MSATVPCSSAGSAGSRTVPHRTVLSDRSQSSSPHAPAHPPTLPQLWLPSAFLAPRKQTPISSRVFCSHLHLRPGHSQVPDGAGAQCLCHLLELLRLHVCELLRLANLQLQLGPGVDQLHLSHFLHSLQLSLLGGGDRAGFRSWGPGTVRPATQM